MRPLISVTRELLAFTIDQALEKEELTMERYETPVMDIELLGDIICTSDDPPIGCGGAEDELPIIPFEEGSDWGED